MANTYKDIIITPFRADANNDPVIKFSSGDATSNVDMNVRFYATSNGTLSFEGTSGQLFSVTNDLTGTIFSVNDISGIPSIEVDAAGKISMAHFGGNVGIGTANATSKLHVVGTANISSTITASGVDLLSNDYSTYLMAKGGIDGANTINTTQTTNITNLTTGLTGANTNITNLTTGLTGANTNLSGNVAIFTGAFTGSNTRLSGAESNVIALQGGLSGSNTNITNLTTGLTGANTNIATKDSVANVYATYLVAKGGIDGANTINTTQTTNITNLTTGLTGANTNITNLTTGLTGANTNITTQTTNITNLVTGLNGANTNINTKDSVANVYITWNYLNANITSFASYANTTFTTNAHIDTKIAAVIDSSPEALNTLRELANALGNDSSFSTTVLTQIGTISANTIALQGGLSGANTNIATKDSIANVYATYLMAKGGIDGANTINTTQTTNITNLTTGLTGANTNITNLTTGLTGSNTSVTNLTTGLTGANTNITNLTTGLTGANTNLSGNVAIFTGAFTGTNTNLSGNVAIFTGAFTGSNTRLSGAESNVIALQGGLTGANTNITNLTTGLTGANTAIALRALAASPTFTGNSTFDTNVLFIDSLNDRVGLLTTLPTHTLDVRGTANTGVLTATSVSSSGVELRANDYATYLMALGGLTGANTNITNLTTGLTGANTNIALRATLANPTFTGVVTIPNLTLTAAGGIEGGQLDLANAITNTTITTGIAIDIYGDKVRIFEKGGTNRGAYLDLSAASAGVGSNLLAGSSTGGSNTISEPISYIVQSYVTSSVNTYPIGVTVSSVNNVSVYLNGVYQNKNQYVLSNSSSNVQFTDATLASSLSLELITIGAPTILSSYIVQSYVTSSVNTYPIGVTVSSVNNVFVHLNGVYQNKNQYVLSNSSSNVQFTDSTLTSSLSLEITTIR